MFKTRQRRKTIFNIGVLAMVLVFFVTACAPAAPEVVDTPEPQTIIITELVEGEIVERTVVVPVEVTPEAPPGRQTIIVALARTPLTLDPADYSHRETENVIRNMFDGLVTRDTRSGVHLEIAESMEWLDETTLEVKLRQGVMFHNGDELTADDVIYTYERILTDDAIEYPEPHSSPRRGFLGPMDSLEKIDDYTVLINFSSPWPVWDQLLVHNQIIPMDYMEEVGAEGFLNNPVGAGPFKFVSATAGYDEIVLQRFDDYWGGAPTLDRDGPACVEGAVFRTIPEASTRVAALLAGEVDIIAEVPPELVRLLEQTPGVDVYTAPSTRPIWMQMNVTLAPFDDVRVRQAMNYAIDVDLLIETLYNGRGQPLAGVLSPLNSMAHPDLEPYPYDPERALELLADAGWEDTNDDGMLDRNGVPMAFTLDSPPEMAALAEALAGMLRELGIDVSVRVWEYGVVLPLLRAGERQAYVSDWGDSTFTPPGHIEAKWHTYTEGVAYWGRGNFSSYSNERVDELIQAGETEADLETRQAMYYEVQEILYEEAPAAFLLLPDVFEAASDRVQNWEPASDSRINLHNVCLGP
ncbi:MAG: ABC transporter substrate-binding protein [Anaerolineales bacterium]